MWILICERTRQLTTINEELRQEIADRQRVEEATPESQAGLAHATRVLWLEELVTSIATESTTADSRGDNRQFCSSPTRYSSAQPQAVAGPALSSPAFARC